MFLIYLLAVVLFFSFLANFAFRKIFKSLSWVDKPDGIKKLHKNDDKFSLHLKNLIKDRLGSGALTQVNHRVINFNGSKIVVIECPKSEKETWLDKREFYVRSHPSTDRLDGPELLQYCRERFNS